VPQPGHHLQQLRRRAVATQLLHPPAGPVQARHPHTRLQGALPRSSAATRSTTRITNIPPAQPITTGQSPAGTEQGPKTVGPSAKSGTHATVDLHPQNPQKPATPDIGNYSTGLQSSICSAGPILARGVETSAAPTELARPASRLERPASRGLFYASPCVGETTLADDRDFRAGLAATRPMLSPDTVGQPGRPALMAISCLFPTSLTTCGGMGSPGALPNSSRTTALPSVNNSTVTALDPSGELPETTVPPVPTGDG
jgi:hypothetical protein